MAHFNGQGGTVTFAQDTYPVETWNLSEEVEILDVTDTGSGGYQENINGIKKASGSFTLYIDDAALPHASGDLRSGNTGTLVCPYGNTGAEWEIPVRLESIQPENPARGQVKLTVNWQSNGSYATGFPTASSS